MRSPSQRWRLSIVERTPPREVWFGISVVEVSTARGVGDVEGDQPREPRIATLRPRGCSSSRRASSVAVSVWRRTRTSSVSSPRRASPPRPARREPEPHPCLVEPLAQLGVAGDGGADQRVVVPVRYFVAGVDDDGGAFVERRGGTRESRPSRRRRPGRHARATAPSREGQQRVRRRLDPHDVGVGGGGPVWSNSTTFRPHGSNCAKCTPVPKYAPSASAIVAPGRQSAKTTR